MLQSTVNSITASRFSLRNIINSSLCTMISYTCTLTILRLCDRDCYRSFHRGSGTRRCPWKFLDSLSPFWLSCDPWPCSVNWKWISNFRSLFVHGNNIWHFDGMCFKQHLLFELFEPEVLTKMTLISQVTLIVLYKGIIQFSIIAG